MSLLKRIFHPESEIDKARQQGYNMGYHAGYRSCQDEYVPLVQEYTQQEKTIKLLQKMVELMDAKLKRYEATEGDEESAT